MLYYYNRNVLTEIIATAIAVSGDVAASIADNSGTVVTAPDLGDQVKIRITYTLPTGLAAGQYAQGLHIYNVELSGYDDFRTVYNLYTANGCVCKMY